MGSFLSFRYKKNIKALYIVHPTMFIKTLLILFKPFIRLVFKQSCVLILFA